MTDQEVQENLDYMRSEIRRNVTITNLEEIEGALLELVSKDFQLSVKTVLGATDAVDAGNTMADLVINLLEAEKVEEGSLEFKAHMDAAAADLMTLAGNVAGFIPSIGFLITNGTISTDRKRSGRKQYNSS